MGCIVNGPGEMADADFGYVGGAPGKIDLYVGKVQCSFLTILPSTFLHHPKVKLKGVSFKSKNSIQSADSTLHEKFALG